MHAFHSISLIWIYTDGSTDKKNVHTTVQLVMILKFVSLRAKVIVALGRPANKRLFTAVVVTAVQSFASRMHVSHLKAILHDIGLDHGTDDGMVHGFVSWGHFG